MKGVFWHPVYVCRFWNEVDESWCLRRQKLVAMMLGLPDLF